MQHDPPSAPFSKTHDGRPGAPDGSPSVEDSHAHRQHDHAHGVHRHGDHSHGHHRHRHGEHHHGEGHRHHHGHSHGHHHAPSDFGRAFTIGIVLNTAFVIIEAAFGFWGNSTALLADAGHNLSDVLGLAVAWIAALLARRAPAGQYTYGMRKSSVLAALANAVLLLVAVGAIAWEALQRLASPPPVDSTVMMAVAAVGIVINGVTAWLFASGRHSDLNIRGAYLHMAADALVSAGVVVAGLIIKLTGQTWIDPFVTLIIVAVIVWGTWSLLRGSLAMAMDAAPEGIDPVDVRMWLEALPGVASSHDLHIWPLSTTETALTVHLLMPEGRPADAFLMEASRDLKSRFNISHVTIQIETDTATVCALAPDNVV